MNLKAYVAGVPVGTARIADLFAADVTLTLFEGSVAPMYAQCTFVSGAHGCYLNAHTPGHAVVRWFNRGFQITPVGFIAGVPFFGNPTNTGPLEVWVDVEERGLTLQTPFETIMNEVEQFIEMENRLIVYYRNALTIAIDLILTIVDPGQTELLVTSPSGEETGRMGDGTINQRIPFSAYFPQIPMVVVMAAEAGDYSTVVRAVQDSDYDLVSAFGDFTDIMMQQEFQGHLATGQAENISSVVPPKLEIKRSSSNLVISWPATVTGFNLESSQNLTSPVWTSVSGVVNNSVSIPISGAAKFYRLRRP